MSRPPRRRIQAAQVLHGGRVLRVTWADGEDARFHALWLVDCAPDASTRDPRNGQRLITLADVPADSVVTAASVDDGRLLVRCEPGQREVAFDADWLFEHRYDRWHPREPGWLPAQVRIWDRTDGAVPLSLPFATVAGDAGALRRWLEAVDRDGVACLCGGPVHDRALLDVIGLFGHARETNYGVVFDVRNEADPTNLAFTAVGLPPHTDNPYRDHQPTLQLLYCLENSAEGGESLVVDGFRAALTLRAQDPEAFALLAGYSARYEYQAGGAHLASRRPMIELAPDGELRAVRLNNRSIAPLTDIPFEHMEAYYGAYRAFEALVEDPSLAITFKLSPGDCFLVDNTRVLHSRTAFSGGGKRWLQGCYADREGLRSTLAVLSAEGTGR